MKELRFSEDHDEDNGLANQDIRDVTKGNKEFNGLCYENKGFNDSNSSKEELYKKV